MKECCTCHVVKPLSDFHKKSDTKDGYQRYCRECHKKINSKHYKDNKQVYIDRAQSRRKRVAQWWQEYKSGMKCSVCGESRHWCLDFHHKDPSEKEGTLSQMIKTNSREAILEELDKCIVVCRNCHADIHYHERISR